MDNSRQPQSQITDTTVFNISRQADRERAGKLFSRNDPTIHGRPSAASGIQAMILIYFRNSS